MRVLMRKMESTYRKFGSDSSKCEGALLLIREEAEEDVEEGRLTADQFAMIDRRMEEYLRRLRSPIE